MSNFIIKNTPSANDLWQGIGGHFDSLVQIICEFVDNSISNLKANNSSIKNIIIEFYEEPEIRVVIKDTGTGIKKLDKAFTLGNQDASETPLNKHGFGFKHALASANPLNDNWKILTRTDENAKKDEHVVITAPYQMGSLKAAVEKGWKGPFRTGTIVEFTCSREMFKTIHRGMRGSYANFNTILDLLVEDLGFIYAGNIKDGDATIVVEKNDNQGGNVTTQVKAIEPDWEQFYQPGNGTAEKDLGKGVVKIEYSFGGIKEKTDSKKYYKRNMSSSGVELRINGRVLAYNLFKEIWATEKHNSYNHLLVQINLVSDKKEYLPPTRTSKNGLREGDEKLDKLYEWIRSHMPEPPKHLADTDNELDLIDELKKAKETHLPEPKTVTTEQFAFISVEEKMRIDLFISLNGEITLYEGKRDITTLRDLYQLRMYWDGLVMDGHNPKAGILLASSHSDSVKKMVPIVNKMMDSNGNCYNFVLKTWKDENIKYPK
ncbi:MAG: ATP-binding protein [Lachnospiraceae bacterium]|jgi:hypothetical protein